MNIRIKLFVPMAAALLLAACGGGDISGTWAKTDSALKIRFDSGKAYVTGLTSMNTEQGTYKVEGNRITLDSPGKFHLELTRNKDGTLHLERLGGTLVKEDAAS